MPSRAGPNRAGRNRAGLILAGLLAGLAAPAGAQDQPQPLEGDYFIEAPVGMSSSGGTGPDDHLFIAVRGDAARWLFKRMPGSGEADECFGGVSKFAGQTQCTRYEDGAVECYFAVDPKTGTLAAGATC